MKKQRKHIKKQTRNTENRHETQEKTINIGKQEAQKT